MFNGIWLVAAEPLTIHGRAYQPGERFELSRTQSGLLLVTGRATIDRSQRPTPPTASEASTPEPEPPKRRRGRPRKVQTDESVTPVDAAPPTRRRYTRRDLEAEE